MPYLLVLLIQIVAVLIIVGLLLWLVTLIPMDATMARIIRVVVIVGVVLWLIWILLQVAGYPAAQPLVHIPK